LPRDQHPANVQNRKNDGGHTNSYQQDDSAVLSGLMGKCNPILRCWIPLIRIYGSFVVSSIDESGDKRSYKCSQRESDTESDKYATNAFHFVPSR